MLKMPVYKLISEMPYSELKGWFRYFSSRPAGWKEDERLSIILQALGVKDASTLFESLKRVKNSQEALRPKKETSVAMQFMANFGHMLKSHEMKVEE